MHDGMMTICSRFATVSVGDSGLKSEAVPADFTVMGVRGFLADRTHRVLLGMSTGHGTTAEGSVR